LQTLVELFGLAVLRVFAVLPQPLVRLLARMSAWLMWKTNGRLRRITEANLAISFPDRPRQDRIRLARMRLYELNLSIIDYGRNWIWSPERLLQDIVQVVGECHLQAAVAGQCGTVVLFPHLGNWEVGNRYLSRRYSVTSLYRKPKSSIFADYIRQAREDGGARLVSTGPGGIRTLLRSLKSGEMVSLLPDQVPPLGFGEFAPFFGEPALTMTLATKLLQRTDAKAVCCYSKRLADGKFELVFRPVDEAIYDPDPRTALAALNRSIESCVLDCPEQYQWQYKRYKFLPNLEKRDYFGDRDG
jgi:KDO2-lipid IV(A) lauroyltransferase